MPAGDVETYFAHGKWRNRVAGFAEDLAEFGTKEAAVRNGHLFASYIAATVDGQHDVTHAVRRRDGTVHYVQVHPRGVQSRTKWYAVDRSR